mmetsp:Transcript_149417/g.478690  ORF Transcript_149417/g.478690 Transcript_149417/m.478690 type:complete len:204 (+) Transcript_149417:241-852(+)
MYPILFQLHAVGSSDIEDRVEGGGELRGGVVLADEHHCVPANGDQLARAYVLHVRLRDAEHPADLQNVRVDLESAAHLSNPEEAEVQVCSHSLAGPGVVRTNVHGRGVLHNCCNNTSVNGLPLPRHRKCMAVTLVQRDLEGAFSQIVFHLHELQPFTDDSRETVLRPSLLHILSEERCQPTAASNARHGLTTAIPETERGWAC